MSEILYTVSPELHRVARLEKGEIVELDFEIPEKPPSLLGAIFLGRVVEIQKPLQAAFVEIGMTKLGLLPLREHKLPLVKQGDAVMVQVNRTENPQENKGVRLTRLITLPLGPLFYVPFKVGLGLSKKLREREKFKDLFPLHSDEGLIVRHWARPDKSLSDLFFRLRCGWAKIQKQASLKPPICLSPPQTLLMRVVRSLSHSDIFLVDDLKISAQTRGSSKYQKEKVFDEKCEAAWESLFSPEIFLPQGGSLYIEETRGLVVIDVNSQGFLRSPHSFNRQAVHEALRQIRLRDLSGKIVIDLISQRAGIGTILQGLDISSDLEIFGMSPMGLLEMIRRRKRLSLPQRLKLQLN